MSISPGNSDADAIGRIAMLFSRSPCYYAGADVIEHSAAHNNLCIKPTFTMNAEYLNATVTFVVGLLALVVYELTKRTERQNAAIVVVMDIRHAEQVVQSILERATVDKMMGPILIENNWAKYKHLFAREFSSDDFASFNRFFNACVEIEDARRIMVQIFYANLHAKASATQERLLDLPHISQPTPGEKSPRDLLIERANVENFAFDPDEPKTRVLRALNLMGRLTNTIAFEKLKRIGKI